MFDEIMRSISVINKYYPELRFTQIMTIAANNAGWKDNDLFYCPDSTIEKGLEILVNKLTF